MTTLLTLTIEFDDGTRLVAYPQRGLGNRNVILFHGPYREMVEFKTTDDLMNAVEHAEQFRHARDKLDAMIAWLRRIG